MVCVAAFIILCIVGIVVAFLSIFKREIGKKYLAVFKKAWHCVFKKVRLQKCDTNFKDDVKNTILKRVILKRPKWVKPLSVIIEILSVLIVVITVWSIVIAIKSLLALWVFGTCNVSKPSACSLTSESCSIDDEEPTNIFELIAQNLGQWGEIFGGIPDRLKAWNEEDFKDMKNLSVLSPMDSKSVKDKSTNYAYDIIDPGCVVCMRSYKNQKSSNFFDNHYTYVVLYPIKNPDGTYRFKNSLTITKVLLAAEYYNRQKETTADDEAYYIVNKMIDRLFTESDESNVSWQNRFNNDLDEEEAIVLLTSWLKDFGASDDDINSIEDLIDSTEIKEILENNEKIVNEKIHAKVIPTLVYDNQKHGGLYKD